MFSPLQKAIPFVNGLNGKHKMSYKSMACPAVDSFQAGEMCVFINLEHSSAAVLGLYYSFLL